MATRITLNLKQVKPILSLNPIDAHKRVITLYKAWYRQIPFICKYFNHCMFLKIMKMCCYLT